MLKKRHLHWAWVAPLVLAVLAAARLLAAGELKPAKQRLRNSIASWTLVPKVHIGLKGVFEVYEDGRPTDHRQGRIKLGQNTRGQKSRACMESGLTYQPRRSSIDINIDGQSIQVGLYFCSWFKIRYGRPVTAAELEPSAVARALSGFFEISGPGLGGGIESVLEKALLPIEVGDRQTLFQSIAFRNPPGWESEVADRELYYRRGRGRDIRIRSRELEPEEIQAGPTIMLQEELPRRLLESARKLDPRAQVQTLARAYEQAGFGMGRADIVYDATYERHHWVIHEAAGRLYTLRARGRIEDQALFDGAMTSLMDSVGPAAPEPALTAGLGDSSGASDLPALTDFGRPTLGEAPSLIDLRAGATPVRVRPGEGLELRMSFEIGGPVGLEVEVTESRTLLYAGERLPNYPVTETTTLTPGRYETVLPETIPEFAGVGRYELTSEVCVFDDCLRQVSSFEVIR